MTKFPTFFDFLIKHLLFCKSLQAKCSAVNKHFILLETFRTLSTLVLKNNLILIFALLWKEIKKELKNRFVHFNLFCAPSLQYLT